MMTTAPAVAADMSPEWLERACLGGNLPELVEWHLQQAALNMVSISGLSSGSMYYMYPTNSSRAFTLV